MNERHRQYLLIVAATVATCVGAFSLAGQKVEADPPQAVLSPGIAAGLAAALGNGGGSLGGPGLVTVVAPSSGVLFDEIEPSSLTSMCVTVQNIGETSVEIGGFGPQIDVPVGHSTTFRVSTELVTWSSGNPQSGATEFLWALRSC